MTQKIVINDCHGGFSLSPDALHEVARRKGLSLIAYPITKNLNGYKDQFGNDFYDRDLNRDDTDLVDIVQEMGERANGELAELKVVEIFDGVGWRIDEYDGVEWVAEQHRTWG